MPLSNPLPRLAILGEFSAGKSSLVNLMLGRSAVPVQATATRVPPIWLSHGADTALVRYQDGSSAEVDPDTLPQLDLGAVSKIDLQLSADVLELCEFVDMPGISDPNLPVESWRRALPQAHGAIWCTSAVQAWRQSEAAFWRALAPQMSLPGILLITQIDKIPDARSRNRLIDRVKRETENSFSEVFPISLSEAHAAGEDAERWRNSGAEAFVEHLVNLALTWESHIRTASCHGPNDAFDCGVPSRITEGVNSADSDTVSNGPSIVPRRIKPLDGAAPTTPRPPARRSVRTLERI